MTLITMAKRLGGFIGKHVVHFFLNIGLIGPYVYLRSPFLAAILTYVVQTFKLTAYVQNTRVGWYVSHSTFNVHIQCDLKKFYLFENKSYELWFQHFWLTGQC